MSENILIEWTGKGAQHIATEHGKVFMIPEAITPVPIAIWETARPWFKDLIVTKGTVLTSEQASQGRFIEHAAKVEVEDVPAKKGPGGKVLETATSKATITDVKDIVDLPDSEARAILEKIVDPSVLETYLTSPELDDKPALKGAVDRRLSEVKEKGSKKKAK
jgi:hypothetical protein